MTRAFSHSIVSKLGLVGMLTLLGAPICGNSSNGGNVTPATAGTKGSRMKSNNLAERLTALDYDKLFMTQNDADLNALWQEPEAPARLEALAADAAAPVRARFLAAEVLFRKKPGYAPTPASRGELAQAYADALQHATMGNPWGLPETLDGAAGQHLVALGDAAVAPLTPLLTDERAIQFSGSKEATYGNSYHYRVKDFAAFFISKIRKVPYKVPEDAKERDAEIAKLRGAL